MKEPISIKKIGSNSTTDETHELVSILGPLIELAAGRPSDQGHDSLTSVIGRGLPKLKPYQIQGVARILKAPTRTLLYDDMGLGKTFQALFSMACWCFGNNAWPVLIVCPASLRLTWVEEIEKWIPNLDISDISVITTGSSIIQPDAKVIICSYRGISTQLMTLLKLNFQYLIADEVHATRSYDSRISLSMFLLSEKIPKAVFLTGTPMLYRPLDIFTQAAMVLSNMEKNKLLSRWGFINLQSMKNRKHFFLCCRDSHLARMLLDPLVGLRDLDICFKSNALHKPGIDTIWGNIEDAMGVFNRNRDISQVNQICMSLSRDHKTEILRVFSLFQAHLKHILTLTSRFSCSVLDSKVEFRNWSTGNIQNVIHSLKVFWIYLTSLPPIVLSIVLYLWNAHRFGITFCEATRRQFTRGSFTEEKWVFKGANRNKISKLGEILLPYIIRRTKNEVLADLPAKIRTIVRINISSKDITDMLSDESQSESYAFRKHADMLGSMSRMTKFRPESICYEMQKLAIQKAPMAATYLIEILESMDREERVLVFAHHLQVFNIIQSKLLERRGTDPNKESYKDFNSQVLTGEVPVTERNNIVNVFQTERVADGAPRVLLLSLAAMGTGFTLTRSSLVLMVELHWSPMLLLQAEDRVHRIGKVETVNIQYFLAQDSMDTSIWPMLSSRLENIEATLPSNVSPIKLSTKSTDSQLLRFKQLVDNTRDTIVPLSNSSKLSFRVSLTNRVYLYQQVSSDVYTPLHETFSLNEFKVFVSELLESGSVHEPNIVAFWDKLPPRLQCPTSPMFLQAQGFVEEWEDLSGTDRNILTSLSKPLSLPLTSCLPRICVSDICGLKNFGREANPAFQMHRAAMWRFGSGNYNTCFISYKSSTGKNGPIVKCIQQAFFGQDALCLFCGSTYEAQHKYLSEYQPSGIRGFFCPCPAPCFTIWHMKCYARTARIELSETEAGVCRSCGVDTRGMFRRAKFHPAGSTLRYQELFCESVGRLCPHEMKAKAGRGSKLHWTRDQKDILGPLLTSKILDSKVLNEGMFWDADHILAVAVGGGEALIGNFQTLCKVCHLQKTKTDLGKISELKREQKRHLKLSGGGIINRRDKLQCPFGCGFKAGDPPALLRHGLVCPSK